EEEAVDELLEDEEVAIEEEEAAEEGASEVTCPSCGHSNPPQKLFCENCGSALDEEGELDEDFDLLDEDLDSI
ncbi:zinc ribbon domain-containing protein, partial [Candidatus Fermentibacterales bacterium]|nr:zinc ribbon domain-containing protein [Candidatus Fermentibacterales bacterium]